MDSKHTPPSATSILHDGDLAAVRQFAPLQNWIQNFIISTPDRYINLGRDCGELWENSRASLYLQGMRLVKYFHGRSGRTVQLTNADRVRYPWS